MRALGLARPEGEGQQPARQRHLVEPLEQAAATVLRPLREVEQRAAFDRDIAGRHRFDQRGQARAPHQPRQRGGVADGERDIAARRGPERHVGPVPQAERQIRLQMLRDMRCQAADAFDTLVRRHGRQIRTRSGATQRSGSAQITSAGVTGLSSRFIPRSWSMASWMFATLSAVRFIR